MKNKFYFLYYFFRPLTKVLIIVLLLLFSVALTAQETTPQEEFPVGAYFNKQTRTVQEYYDKFELTGMDWIVQYAADNTQEFVEPYNLMADNADSSSDYIMYYATAWYSKWEAEENQEYINKVGVKHTDGEDFEWKGESCWSSIGITNPTAKIVYGPHYHQEKYYKRWWYETVEERYTRLKYIPRFRMALSVNGQVGQQDTICNMYVVVRHSLEGSNDNVDDTLKGPITLQVSDFPIDSTFKEFYLGPPNNNWYQYPPEFRDNPDIMKQVLPENQGEVERWVDIYGNQGVQFCIDWLRNDTKYTLYIDYIEVYDLEGWNVFAEGDSITVSQTIQDIKGYAQTYSGWPNLKYWTGHSEPFSLDAYTPMKTVDAIVKSAFPGAPSIITTFYPYWETKINEDIQLERYYNTVQPEKLMIDFYPFSANYSEARFEDWEAYREQLQISSSLQPGFYYWAQAFGYRQGDDWLVWRQPDSTELKAQTMLALAHGVKGIIYMAFDAYQVWEPNFGTYIHEGIIDTQKNPTDLFFVLKDNLIPRLKGTLGNTLMNLDYTGSYINREYHEGIPPDQSELEYLSIQHYGMSYFWHAGFFNEADHLDNKYFLLTSLRTEEDITAKLTVSNNTGYENVSFTDIEGGVDTTIEFESSITYYEEMPAGEGRLYRVSPVILYGGRLIYDEVAGDDITLMDDMTIENGATLSINNTYFANGNIIIKDGSIVNLENGKIQFASGKKLIIKGPATISGTEGNKLILDFVSPENENGIVIDSEGSLNISYCEVKNAVTGILAEVESISFDIQYVDFIDCGESSINILGQTPELFGSTQRIKYCTIQNSSYGISVANLEEVIIQDNWNTGTDLGIFLSSVTNSEVVDNILESSSEELPGIMLSSSGGLLRANYISGHSVGIHLGNSSPKLGSNLIYSNKYHGIYVGSGSVPYMREEIAGAEPEIYALSGHNEVRENGGWEETNGPLDNDGSEIYFYDSNTEMLKGCNSIYDNREPSDPLINTFLLMNGIGSTFILSINAEWNFWGDSVSAARFGDITVDYNPYYTEACPQPDGPSGGAENELIVRTSSGEIILSINSTGEEVLGLTDLELDYAEAEEYFLTGELIDALQMYEIIISSSATEEEKYLAYKRKYVIGKILNQTPEFFNSIGDDFTALASNSEDSLDKKIFEQLAILSKVGEEEYTDAINEFDGIVQQNPNSEEAVYAEIDALTTALLVEGNDSTMQKGTLNKYIIKTSADYNAKLNGILRKNFGGKGKETEKEILPTEYILYQNYPNPFNPTTIIKYDLPNTSEVSIIIYDILGRKIKELVSEEQQAGRYEVQFNASGLASGVYIYQLVADNPSTSSGQGYMNSKKMILLK